MPEVKKILIVEDEPAMSNVLRAKLEKEGFEIFTASNGKVALEIIEQQKFDLILLDLIMPIKDGFVFLEDLQKTGNNTPVIISSNLGQDEDIIRAKELGAVDYFVKSDTPLIKVVEHIKNVLK